MYATATIELAHRKKALAIPETAVLREGAATYCNCVRNGKIERHAVQLGIRSGSDVEVLSGLKEEDEVVLTRAESLTAGQAVEEIEPKE